MIILIARNKQNVRYDARTKCTFFDKYIIMLTPIQFIHELFFSAKQYNINESPTVSSEGEKLRRGSRGWRRWMFKSLKV